MKFVCRLQLQLHQIFTYLFIWAIFEIMNDSDPMAYDLSFVFYWLLSHTCLWLCFSSHYPWPSFFLLSCMCNILDIYYSDINLQYDSPRYVCKWFIYLIQNLLIFTEPNERLRDFCIKRKYHPTQIKAHSETAWAALFSQTWN